RRIAETFLSQTLGRNLADLEFLEAEREARPNRTDHTFTWIQKNVDLGEAQQRIAIGVFGDRVGSYREYIHIPEQWLREYEQLRSRNNAAQIVDEVFWILLSVAMVIILVSRLRQHDVPIRLSLGFGAVAAALVFLDRLNTFSLAQFNYSTSDTYAGF